MFVSEIWPQSRFHTAELQQPGCPRPLAANVKWPPQPARPGRRGEWRANAPAREDFRSSEFRSDPGFCSGVSVSVFQRLSFPKRCIDVTPFSVPLLWMRLHRCQPDQEAEFSRQNPNRRANLDS